MKGIGFIGFLIPIMALVAAVTWVGYDVVVKNLSAKDVVFSFTTLVAALVMFLLNVTFSLKNEYVEKIIQPHLTLNGGVLDVYVVKGEKSRFIVFARESLSSAFCLDKVPNVKGVPQFNREEGDIFKKNIINYLKVSVIGELLLTYPDWSPSEKAFRGNKYVNFRHSQGDPSESSFHSIQSLQSVLGVSPEKFSLSDFTGIANGLTLPPETTVESNDHGLLFDNPYVTVSIEIEVDSSLSYAQPIYDKSGRLIYDHTNDDMSVLNVQSNIRVITLRKKQRHGSPQYALYTKWTDSIVSTLERGFSPI